MKYWLKAEQLSGKTNENLVLILGNHPTNGERYFLTVVQLNVHGHAWRMSYYRKTKLSKIRKAERIIGEENCFSKSDTEKKLIYE